MKAALLSPMRILQIQIFISIFLFLVSACAKEDRSLPTCKISQPKKDLKIIHGRMLTTSVAVPVKDFDFSHLEIFIDEKSLVTLNIEPFVHDINTAFYACGIHQIRAIANDASGKSATDEITIHILPYTPPTPFTDFRDGNVYETIEIGDQVWMKENLRFSHKHAQYVNNDHNNTPDYGFLYMTRIGSGEGICPDDWRIPSHSDWDKLVSYLGGDEIAGGKLKDTGFVSWEMPNTGATNESGFSAMPAGSLSWDTIPQHFGQSARFFTSSYGTYKFINFDSGKMQTINYHPSSEFYSIRCVREY